MPPPKKKPSLAKIMETRFQSLLLDFEGRFSADQVSHAGERGRLLEDALSSLLGQVLPKRIGIGSGQIVGARSVSPSKQVDIVIYDEINFPPLLSAGLFQLLVAESVLAVIEVKSTLSKRSLSQAIDNITSVKSLKKFPAAKFEDTIGILFAYRTSWKKGKTLFKNLRASVQTQSSSLPDVICCLDPGFLLVSTDSMGQSVANMTTLLAGMEKNSTYPPHTHIFIRPLDFSRSHILLWFYLVLIDRINQTLKIGVNMSQYIRLSSAWTIDVVDLFQDEITISQFSATHRSGT